MVLRGARRGCREAEGLWSAGDEVVRRLLVQGAMASVCPLFASILFCFFPLIAPVFFVVVVFVRVIHPVLVLLSVDICLVFFVIVVVVVICASAVFCCCRLLAVDVVACFTIRRVSDLHQAIARIIADDKDN